jgi:hypothetical protein
MVLKEYIFGKDIDMKREINLCVLMEALEIKEYFLVCYGIIIYLNIFKIYILLY